MGAVTVTEGVMIWVAKFNAAATVGIRDVATATVDNVDFTEFQCPATERLELVWSMVLSMMGVGLPCGGKGK